MDGLPNKMMFSVAEVAELLGVSLSTVYDMVQRSEPPFVSIGTRRLVTRHALAAFLGIPADEDGAAASARAVAQAKDEEQNEWTYVVTVKRLRRGETARIEQASRADPSFDTNWRQKRR